jgi:hypothetical protein
MITMMRPASPVRNMSVVAALVHPLGLSNILEDNAWASDAAKPSVATMQTVPQITKVEANRDLLSIRTSPLRKERTVD